MQFDPLKLFIMCRKEAMLRYGLTHLCPLLREGHHAGRSRLRAPAYPSRSAHPLLRRRDRYDQRPHRTLKRKGPLRKERARDRSRPRPRPRCGTQPRYPDSPPANPDCRLLRITPSSTSPPRNATPTPCSPPTATLFACAALTPRSLTAKMQSIAAHDNVLRYQRVDVYEA